MVVSCVDVHAGIQYDIPGRQIEDGVYGALTNNVPVLVRPFYITLAGRRGFRSLILPSAAAPLFGGRLHEEWPGDGLGKTFQVPGTSVFFQI